MLRQSVGRAGRRDRGDLPGSPRRRHRLLAGMLLFLAAAGWLAVWLDRNIRPVMLSNAQYECERYANAAFRAALEQQEGERYDGLYELVCSEDGAIQAVTLNSGRINQLEAELAQAIQAELNGYSGAELRMSLPLGVLLGGQLWMGPRLMFRLDPDAVVAVDIYDTLESAGINQTRLCLRARFTAQMSAILAGYGVSTDVEQDVLLVEILLAGDVPQGYLWKD